MKVNEFNVSNLRKVAVGTVAVIGLCSSTFFGITQSVKASVINKTEIVPTKYLAASTIAYKTTVPEGYVKADYKVAIEQSKSTPSEKDISAEKAAELGAQDLWRLFGCNLSGKTINMYYSAASNTQLRTQWMGNIIDNNQNYMFSIDSVTGEILVTGQERYLSGSIDTGMDKTLLKDCEKYKSLAIETAKKYNLVSGKIASAEYAGQGCYSNNAGLKNSDISIIVKSEDGQQAQLTFSRHNQEFLIVGYDSWVKDTKAMEKKLSEEAQKNNASTTITSDGEKCDLKFIDEK